MVRSLRTSLAWSSVGGHEVEDLGRQPGEDPAVRPAVPMALALVLHDQQIAVVLDELTDDPHAAHARAGDQEREPLLAVPAGTAIAGKPAHAGYR